MTTAAPIAKPAAALNHREFISRLEGVAIRSLVRMWDERSKLFVFRLRRAGNEIVAEGRSSRYTAIVLVGLASRPDLDWPSELPTVDLNETCLGLIQSAKASSNLGDTALTLWAAALLQHPASDEALRHLIRLDPIGGSHPTVEIAWALTALAAAKRILDLGQGEVDATAKRLKANFRPTGMFPHWPDGTTRSRLRGHVACFADKVYPVQALAHYHSLRNDEVAGEISRTCAEQMCRRQGAQGQWWWHFDIRTGEVVEQYPVYAVHQNSMAPMALLDLREACGIDHSDAILHGLSWLAHSPEIRASLVDIDADVIWRKVARREPGKLSRGLQALSSRIHPSLRVPGMDALLPPVAVDYESRPYHMGWILYAWRGQNAETLRARSTT